MKDISIFWIVLQREYLTRVRRKWFLVSTLLTPLIMIAVLGGVIYLGLNSKDKSDKHVYVVDMTKQYFDIINNTDSEDGFIFHNTDKSMSEALELQTDGNEDIFATIVISGDLLRDPKALTIYSEKSIPPALEEHLAKVLNQHLTNQKIASYHIDNLEQIIRNAEVQIQIETIKLDDNGEQLSNSSVVGVAIGQLFNVLMFAFITSCGGMVMQSVREEKKNRIVEIIASSVKPSLLLGAKIIACGVVGLTQFLIWGIFLFVVSLVLQGVLFSSITLDPELLQESMKAASMQTDMEIEGIISSLFSFDFVGIILVFLFYFITGYVSFASVYAAIGAAVDNDEDLGQFILPVTLLMMFGFYGALYSAGNPDAPLSVYGSFVPLIAPSVMMARYPFDPPTWQLIVSMLLMIVWTLLFVLVSGKIFRVGLLIYGKKITLKELIRWIRFH